MNKIKKLDIVLLRQIFLYGIFGVIAAIVDFALFIVGVHVFKMNLFVANLLGMVIGMVVSFILNTFLNFKKSDNLHKRFITFIMIGISGIILSEVIIFVLHILIRNESVIKIISQVIIAAYQFVLNKKITYKEK